MKHRKRFFIACAALMATVLATAGMGTISAQAGHGVRPKKAVISKSTYTVTAGREFEIKAKITPRHAEDDYVRWEITSGKDSVKFADRDRSGDDVELLAVKEGTAVVRCYIAGKNKDKYGDTIKITVQKAKTNGTIKRDGSATVYEEVYDDFDLEVKTHGSVKAGDLKWSIADESIVTFAHPKHRTGKEVEFYAEKTGTTTVTCTYTGSDGKTQKVSYKVVVTWDDDDWDDDDWDHDHWDHWDD